MGHYDCKECGAYPTYCKCDKPTPNTLEQQIKDAEAHLAGLKQKQSELKWPVKTIITVSLITDRYCFPPFKETYKSGVPAWNKLAKTATNIQLHVDMYATGTVKATHINGTKITSPVEI